MPHKFFVCLFVFCIIYAAKNAAVDAAESFNLILDSQPSVRTHQL